MKLRFLALVHLLMLVSTNSLPGMRSTNGKSFNIGLTWDGKPVDHVPAKITLTPGPSEIRVSVSAPFFNDPAPPGGLPGQAFFGLWEYEVVEAFFLNDKDQYLEVEFGPHGQHIVLLLNGRRNAVKHTLPLEYSATINNETMTWTGEARIPADYFPPEVTLFNAYAIHGTADDRKYEALYESSGPQADFHRLEKFQPIEFSELLPSNKGSELSSLWKVSIEESELAKQD